MKFFKNILPLLFLLCIIFISCKNDNPVDPPTPPDTVLKDTLTLSVTDVTHHSISVNVKTTNNGTGRQIQLFRKAGTEPTFSPVTVYPATVIDTTIIDYNESDGLQLDTEYSYYAVRLDSLGMPKDSSTIVSGRTLAATSHEYEWEEFNISGMFYDVWGTDENNVYAVGSVRLNDTMYGIIKWDGVEWKPEKRIGGGVAIYGFSENDIWVAGGGVFHFDGNIWNQLDSKTVDNRSVPLDSVLFNNGSYTSIWGTSSSNLYLGNLSGDLIKWDGNKASIFKEFPNSYISDINGIKSGEMWVVGRGDGKFVSNFSKGVWQQFKDQRIIGGFHKSIYPISNEELIVGGNGLITFINNKWNNVIFNWQGSIFKIRGTGSNNIFGVGAHNSIYHFNGVDWKYYENLVKTGGILYGVYVEHNTVFMVGVNSIIIGRKK